MTGVRSGGDTSELQSKGHHHFVASRADFVSPFCQEALSMARSSQHGLRWPFGVLPGLVWWWGHTESEKFGSVGSKPTMDQVKQLVGRKCWLRWGTISPTPGRISNLPSPGQQCTSSASGRFGRIRGSDWSRFGPHRASCGRIWRKPGQCWPDSATARPGCGIFGWTRPRNVERCRPLLSVRTLGPLLPQRMLTNAM